MQNVKEADASHGTAKEAAIVLATAPDDSAANLNVGRFRCFIKGDWTAGLLHLAKGSDLRLKALAAGDLRTPTDTGAESPLADGWADAAEFKPGLAKKQIERTSLPLVSRSLGERHRDEADSGRGAIEADSRGRSGHFVRHELVDQPATNAKPPSQKPPLIVKARWGGGNNWSDVTKRVREAVASGTTVSETWRC